MSATSAGASSTIIRWLPKPSAKRPKSTASRGSDGRRCHHSPAASTREVKQHVQRVDLADDGLRPEGVGRAQQQASPDPGQHRPGERRRHPDQRATGSCAGQRRGQVQAVCGFAAGDGKDRVGDGVVERVGLPRRQPPVADRRLVGGSVAEVDSGQQRGVVAGKREGRHERRRRPGAGPVPARRAGAMRVARGLGVPTGTLGIVGMPSERVSRPTGLSRL